MQPHDSIDISIGVGVETTGLNLPSRGLSLMAHSCGALGSRNNLCELIELLRNPLASSLFEIHPNKLGAGAQDCTDPISVIPDEWHCWWDWAAQETDQWTRLVELNTHCGILVTSVRKIHKQDTGLISLDLNSQLKDMREYSDIPIELQDLIWNVNRLALPRTPDAIPDAKPPLTHPASCVSGPKPKAQRNTGMSPKKTHEVDRLSAYLAALICSFSSKLGMNINHVVDVGAGQGYLSRALYALPHTSALLQSENPASQPGTLRPLHVLALDSSPHQTAGAQRRQALAAHAKSRSNAPSTLTPEELRDRTTNQKSDDVWDNKDGNTGTLNHSTVCIGRDEDSLSNVIDEWLAGLSRCGDSELQGGTSLDSVERTDEHQDGRAGSESMSPIPVLFVALHACGSLTPSLLRSVLSYQRVRDNDPLRRQGRSWYAVAAVVVGCCYNLLDPRDFPLSTAVVSCCTSRSPVLELTPSHLQLAAQVPAQWFRTAAAKSATSLAVRKVVFRAGLEGYLHSLALRDAGREGFDQEAGSGARKRLGKLNDKAYETFDTFLRAAGEKLGVDLTRVPLPQSISEDGHSNFPLTGVKQSSHATETPSFENTHFFRRLQVLHTLRSLLGPAVESLIILDRVSWIRDATGVASGARMHEADEVGDGTNLLSMDARIVKLFDQATDSGRNVGIVFAPKLVLP